MKHTYSFEPYADPVLCQRAQFIDEAERRLYDLRKRLDAKRSQSWTRYEALSSSVFLNTTKRLDRLP